MENEALLKQVRENPMLLKEIEILKHKEAKERQPQKKFVLHQQLIKLRKDLN